MTAAHRPSSSTVPSWGQGVPQTEGEHSAACVVGTSSRKAHQPFDYCTSTTFLSVFWPTYAQQSKKARTSFGWNRHCVEGAKDCHVNATRAFKQPGVARPETARFLRHRRQAATRKSRRCQRWLHPNRLQFARRRPQTHLPPWVSRGTGLSRRCRPVHQQTWCARNGTRG